MGDQRSNVLPIYDGYHGIRCGLTIIEGFGRTLDGCERCLLIYLILIKRYGFMYSGWQDIGRNIGRTLVILRANVPASKKYCSDDNVLLSSLEWGRAVAGSFRANLGRGQVAGFVRISSRGGGSPHRDGRSAGGQCLVKSEQSRMFWVGRGDRAVSTGVPMPGSEEAWAMGCRCDGISGVVVDCLVHGPVRCLMPMCGREGESRNRGGAESAATIREDNGRCIDGQDGDSVL